MLSRWFDSGVRAAALAFWVSLTVGCASTGPFTWYRDVPREEWTAQSEQYVIGVGDRISVEVYQQEELTKVVQVRTDGKFAMPFIGEVQAAGKPPALLADEIASRLKEFFVTPRVTVGVEESPPLTVHVLGEVGSQGMITLQPHAGLLQALALSGGPSEFADRDAIFVIRKAPQFRRIRFTYESLVHNDQGAATFSLRPGDVIVVE